MDFVVGLVAVGAQRPCHNHNRSKDHAPAVSIAEVLPPRVKTLRFLLIPAQEGIQLGPRSRGDERKENKSGKVL
jgi:hypothetical protein